MPRIRFAFRKLWLAPLLIAVAVGLPACQRLNLGLNLGPFAKAEEEKVDPFDKVTADEDGTPLVGDYISIHGLNAIELEGVGLVTGLDGTGGDPPVSAFRTMLLDDMRKLEIHEPNKVLQSPSTALVLVRAKLPPLMRKGDTFDVEVRLPGGSEATSLNGGYLLSCDLTEQKVIPGQGMLKGNVMAKAEGPILISAAEGDVERRAGVLLRGTIPGGARSLREDRFLAVYLRSDYRSVRMSRRVAGAIGRRFHDYDEYGIRRPLAEAKTDSRIELSLHDRYVDNYPRYLQVIRHVAFKEGQIDRRIRMEQLRKDLLIGPKSARAAIELEAIGMEGVPVLRHGLQADNFESRVNAAIALAYLGNADGVDVLKEAARDERAFRVFALAALASLEPGDVVLPLRELTGEESVELRYGAFRALTTLDEHDPWLGGVDMDGKFKLYLVHSEGEPLIHLTRRQRSEIVLFGGGQRFEAPLAVRAGTRIIVRAEAGSDKVTVSRFEPGKDDRREVVSSRVAEVIATVVKFGASYPDVVQMLVQAERQQNLPGEIAIDTLPRPGRSYYRRDDSAAETQTARSRSTKVGHENLSPNLFGLPGDAVEDDEPEEEHEQEAVDPKEDEPEQIEPEQIESGQIESEQIEPDAPIEGEPVPSDQPAGEPGA